MGDSFESPRDYKNHVVAKHTSVQKYQYGKCFKIFQTSANFEAHKTEHSEPEVLGKDNSNEENRDPNFQCENCDEAFLTKTLRQNHLKNCHDSRQKDLQIRKGRK